MEGENTVAKKDPVPEHDQENDEEELMLLERSLHHYGLDSDLHDGGDSDSVCNSFRSDGGLMMNTSSDEVTAVTKEATEVTDVTKEPMEQKRLYSRTASLCLPPSKSSMKRRNTIERIPSSSTQSKRVSFANLEVRQYPIILGDHPDCSSGPPVTIGWEYENCGNIDVTAYESLRRERREIYDLGIPFGVRDRILRTSSGYTDDELRIAIAEVRRVQRQRIRTRKRLYLSNVEEKIQSAGRKLGRIFGRRKDSSTTTIAPAIPPNKA